MRDQYNGDEETEFSKLVSMFEEKQPSQTLLDMQKRYYDHLATLSLQEALKSMSYYNKKYNEQVARIMNNKQMIN